MARHGSALSPPGAEFWLGTDNLGRSVACLSFYGLRASLIVAGSVMGISLLLGLLVGLVTGLAPTRIDAALMQLTAAFQVVPRFFLAIVVAALFGPSLVGLILVLAATSWPLIARLIRAETLTLREGQFVLAARALGCSPMAILWRHILANAIPPVRASLAALTAGAVAAEAALGFVGLGDGKVISLGRLIADAYQFLFVAPWVSTVPVAVLVATVLALQASIGARGPGAASRRQWILTA
ncbi:MAG: ABC transporter permease [Pigmentiphaga sp.]